MLLSKEKGGGGVKQDDLKPVMNGYWSHSTLVGQERVLTAVNCLSPQGLDTGQESMNLSSFEVAFSGVVISYFVFQGQGSTGCEWYKCRRLNDILLLLWLIINICDGDEISNLHLIDIIVDSSSEDTSIIAIYDREWPDRMKRSTMIVMVMVHWFQCSQWKACIS
jgi:hypothetical protein